MDIMDDNAVVPSHQGGIFIKATRLSTPAASTPAPAPAASRPTPAPMQRADSATKTSPVSAAPPVPPKPVKHTPAAPKQEEKLLSFHDEPSPIIPAAAPAPAPAPTPSYAAPQTQSSPFFEDDLLGFSSVPSSTTTTTSQVNLLYYFSPKSIVFLMDLYFFLACICG